MTTRARATILIVFGSLLYTVAYAQDRHPAYLHARTDLRKARLLISGDHPPNVQDHMHHAGIEIDSAIKELDLASTYDHKNVDDNPPIDTSLDRPGRIHKAVELLRGARRDIEQEEDNPAAKVWQQKAFEHIQTAIEACKNAAKVLGVTDL